MKAYKDYLDNFSAGTELQNKTLSRLNTSINEKHETILYNGQKRQFMRTLPAWPRVVCMIAALCVALTATAYAVVRFVTWEPAENADAGGSFLVEPISEEDYKSYLESLDFSNQIISTTIYRHGFVRQAIIDEEVMQMLDERLRNRVFTLEGQAFELFVPVPGGFQADNRGIALYDENGSEIGDISYVIAGTNEFIIDRLFPNGIRILSVEEVAGWFDFSDTYDEAAAFLGKDFRLPAVHTSGFGPPEFRLNGDESFTASTGRRAVYVSQSGNPGIYFFVETNRDTEADADIRYAPGAVITQGEISGVTVYKIESEEANSYTWTFDGLTYMFSQSKSDPVNVDFSSFTDEECEEIIRSMID